MLLSQGAVHKRRPHIIAQNWSPYPLSVRTHHKFQKKFEDFAPKSADIRI